MKFWRPKDGRNNILILGEESTRVHYRDGGKAPLYCRTALGESCPFCERADRIQYSDPQGFRDLYAWMRTAYKIIDFSTYQEEPEVLIWLAGKQVSTQVDGMKQRSLTVYREGRNLSTQYRVYPYNVNILLWTLIGVFGKMLALPQIEYLPTEEIDRIYQEIYGSEEPNWDEAAVMYGWEGTDFMEEREYCARGHDTTDQFPLGPCFQCVAQDILNGRDPGVPFAIKDVRAYDGSTWYARY